MIAIDEISAANALVFKAVRLQALLESPVAFGSTYAKEFQDADDVWVHRAGQSCREGCVGYLAIDLDVVCGIVRATPDDADSTVIWIESMWTAPSHRRSGIGRRLIEQVLTWARERRIASARLEVTSHNESAIRFYQGLGFEFTGKTEPYRHDKTLMELEMLLRLS
jgi:ribosomal protein S18 acetylase RimI-like enzyme